MASPSPRLFGSAGPSDGAEYFDRPAASRRSSEIIPSPTQDVTVPAHLLRTVGKLGSKRDNAHTTHAGGWEPTQDNPFLDTERMGSLRRNRTQDSAGLHRNGTQGSARLERTDTQGERKRTSRLSWFSNGGRRNSYLSGGLPSPAEEEENTRAYKTLSYIQGSNDILSTPRMSRAPSRENLHRSPSTSSKYSSSDPFASKAHSVRSNPFATENNSARTSLDDLPRQPAAAHEGMPQRKGTVRTIVDRIVPDALQRSMTNASYFKRSDMYGTYEKAKKKGVDIQRKPWVQNTFEWSIYLFLVLFVYFVLIGMPLWRGAVWWMYWIVETKFVLPGGFGITLGIALL